MAGRSPTPQTYISATFPLPLRRRFRLPLPVFCWRFPVYRTRQAILDFLCAVSAVKGDIQLPMLVTGRRQMAQTIFASGTSGKAVQSVMAVYLPTYKLR